MMEFQPALLNLLLYKFGVKKKQKKKHPAFMRLGVQSRLGSFPIKNPVI